MSKFKVTYSSAASLDLENIVSYIIEHFKDINAAKSISHEIKTKIRSLNEMPERYALVDWEPWFSMNIHKFPVKNYVVFYQVDNKAKEFTVIRIFYSGRDIENVIKG